MQLDFNKLQKHFIEKIKSEESICLRPVDVSFVVEPNYELKGNATFRILVFGKVFSHGYINEHENEEDLLKDCYSRLHDYNTDSPKWHIWGLKILDLEERYEWQMQKILEYIESRSPNLKRDEVQIEITDLTGDLDENGFRRYGLCIYLKGEMIIRRIVDPQDYKLALSKEIIEELGQLRS